MNKTEFKLKYKTLFQVDFVKDLDQLLQAEREKMWSKDKIELSRTIGEWQGMLEGICQQNIPQELKDTLEVKIAELRGTK